MVSRGASRCLPKLLRKPNSSRVKTCSLRKAFSAVFMLSFKCENTIKLWKTATTAPSALLSLAAARVESCFPFLCFISSGEVQSILGFVTTKWELTLYGKNGKLRPIRKHCPLEVGKMGERAFRVEIWAIQVKSVWLWEEILTFDTHPGPTREDGLPPTEWPQLAGWRRPLGSCPAFVGWWWRWWSWSSTGCPKPGGRPAPPPTPHLRKDKGTKS